MLEFQDHVLSFLPLTVLVRSCVVCPRRSKLSAGKLHEKKLSSITNLAQVPATRRRRRFFRLFFLPFLHRFSFSFCVYVFFCHCRRHFVALVKISDDLKQRPRCESLALSFFLWFPTEWNCWFFHVRDFKSQLRFLCALVSASKIIECLLSAWHDTDLWLGRVARVRVHQQCAKQRQEKRN